MELIIITLVAMVAHEANRAYCMALGDLTQLIWGDAPDWQKESAIAGVRMHLANPGATPEDSHASWLAQKVADGWVYGPVKDADKKEHPCCVPYDELPADQKAKDYIFRGTVHAAYKAITEGSAEAIKALPKAAAQVAVAAVSAVSPAIGELVVLYIGRRESWTDNQYGTGLMFVTGQARALPGDLAQKFLRHADLFELGEAGAEVATDTVDLLADGKKQVDAQRTDLDKLQDLRDQVMLMDKEGLKQFASTHYRQNINKTLKVETLREQVIGLIDQFGAV